MPFEQRPRRLCAIGAVIAGWLMVASACSAATQITETASRPDPAAVSTEVTAEPEAGNGADTDTEGSSADESEDGTPEGSVAVDEALDEVFREIVDSIVYIQTSDDTSGTGIVLEGGWILTNAHVVDRFEEVRIGRSDGRDLGEHPVGGLDWVFDLAIVGPVDDQGLVPFERTPSADLDIGDRVMLIGFPDESSGDPTPTLTAGILSRRRRPALGDFPFLQVDATIAPGQSGGALIDGAGNLVGVSGLEFGQGEFGLAFESDPMWPRIDRLIANADQPEAVGPPVFDIVDDIGPHRSLGFLLDVDESGQLRILAVSDDDVYIDLQSLGGVTVNEFDPGSDPFVVPREADVTSFFKDELLEGGEELVGELDPGRYQVVIGSFAESPSEVSINSDNELRRFEDPEEGAQLPIGELVEGGLDWALDSDRWALELSQGDEITITTDGIADTILAVRLDGEVIVSSDDEQIGVFGTGSRVAFTAPETATYEVEIGSFDETRWGYLVLVELS